MKKTTFLLILITITHFKLFAQPANNTPCGATLVSVNETCVNSTFSFNGTETDSNIGVPNCSSYSGDDLWYQFVMPNDGKAVSILTSYASGAFYDTAIEVFYTNSDCNNLIYLGCDDDGNPATDTDNELFSQIDVVRPIGTTIYFRVWHYETPLAGDFNLCLSKIDAPLQATNDECSTAIELIAGADCSSPTLATNFQATASAQSGPSCEPNAGNDVWFKINIDDSSFYDILIETSQASGSVFDDTGMAVYTATDSNNCGAGLTEIDCNDDIGGGNTFSRINLTGRRNETLFVRVYPAVIQQTGTFNICAAKTAILGVENENLLSFNLFPNPAKDFVNIKVNQLSSNKLDVSLYSLDGKMVLSTSKSIQNNQTQLDVSNLKSGMYFLKITNDDKELVKKLIIN